MILRPRALFYRTDCTRRSKFLTHTLHVVVHTIVRRDGKKLNGLGFRCGCDEMSVCFALERRWLFLGSYVPTKEVREDENLSYPFSISVHKNQPRFEHQSKIKIAALFLNGLIFTH